MKTIVRSLGALALAWAAQAMAQAPLPDVRISVPGPGSSVSLPLELAIKTGADAAEGIRLRLKFVGGGAVALQDLKAGDADFGVFGLPAAILARQKDDQYVALAAVEDRAVWAMMVRQDLRGKVRKVSDLKGRIIGTHSSSLMAKTTGDVITRLVLARNGVNPNEAQVTSAGQNWETQSAAILSKSVDAVMSDEPIATRMVRAKMAFPVYNSAIPADAKNTPGVGFLRATLIARKDRVNADPELTARVVRTLQRVLATMATSGPENIADWMSYPPGEERDTFIAVWEKHPNQYSHDGRFSVLQMRETEAFVRASEPDNADIQKFSVDSMVIDRWAGRKP